MINYFNKLYRWIFNPKPRDTIYGSAAMSCRFEIVDIKRQHYELLKLRSQGKATKKDIDDNISRLDKVEEQYFGKI